MKITEDVLRDLDFKYLDDKWELHIGGYRFYISPDNIQFNVWRFQINGYSFSFHLITDVEEMFYMIAKDAEEEGKDNFRRELREMLDPPK